MDTAIRAGPSPHRPVVIQCDIRAGRTQEQKSALARGIAKVVQETIGAPPEYIYVIIRETPGAQHFHGGEFLPEYRSGECTDPESFP